MALQMIYHHSLLPEPPSTPTGVRVNLTFRSRSTTSAAHVPAAPTPVLTVPTTAAETFVGLTSGVHHTPNGCDCSLRRMGAIVAVWYRCGKGG